MEAAPENVVDLYFFQATYAGLQRKNKNITFVKESPDSSDDTGLFLPSPNHLVIPEYVLFKALKRSTDIIKILFLVTHLGGVKHCCLW